jgi:hypothetical protein
MKKFFLTVLVALTLYYVFLFFLPDKSTINGLISISLFFVILLPFYFNRFLNHKDLKFNSNFGLIFFVVMTFIFIIGNLNYYVTNFLYPAYILDINSLNLYWMSGMVLFSEGYFSLSKKIGIKREVLVINNNVAYTFFAISVISTFLIIFKIGYMPFLHNQKGLNVELSTGTFLTRLWSLNLFSALLFLMLFFKNNKIYYLFFIGANIFFSIIFNQRMLPFAIMCSMLILVLFLLKNKKILLVIALCGAFIYTGANFVFLKNRADIQDNSKDLNSIQNTFIRSSFGEYHQLARLMESDIPLQKGKTFMAIPLSFIPSFVLTPFGITKSQYMNNNSATLLAQFEQSITSTGLRTGILGEFYINFSYYGIFLMFIIGRLVAYLRNQYLRFFKYDFRRILIISIYTLLLYSLIGQIDAIASQMANYLIISFIFIYLWKRYLIFDIYKIRMINLKKNKY